MSWEFCLFLIAGALAGGFINGLAGFGTALLTLSFWLQVMPARQAVAMTVVMAVASGIQGMWLVRYEIAKQPRRLMRFLVPGLFGLPIGIVALNYVDGDSLKLVIAVFLLLYGSFFAFRKNLPKLTRDTPLIDSIVGFAGGVFGGAASLSGALPTMWCAMRPWPKSETRAVLQPFNFAILGLALASFALQGSYDRDTLILIAIALPGCLIGAKFGIMVFKKLNDSQFQRFLMLSMFATGLILGLRELM